MRGRSCHRTPGSRWRRGPIEVNGLARFDQIGSVKTWIPLCWSSSVEWLTIVTSSSRPSTRSGGLDGSTSEIKRGEGSIRLVSFHRRRSRKPRVCGAPGLKKRLPSKWLESCAWPCCTNLYLRTLSGGLVPQKAPTCRTGRSYAAPTGARHLNRKKWWPQREHL